MSRKFKLLSTCILFYQGHKIYVKVRSNRSDSRKENCGHEAHHCFAGRGASMVSMHENNLCCGTDASSRHLINSLCLPPADSRCSFENTTDTNALGSCHLYEEPRISRGDMAIPLFFRMLSLQGGNAPKQSLFPPAAKSPRPVRPRDGKAENRGFQKAVVSRWRKEVRKSGNFLWS